MASTNTPNMNLIVPTAGSEPGPTYADDINASLSIIDAHDHSAGSGVKITPAGMNINAALTMAGNFLTNVAGVTLSAQVATPANNTVYENGVDLYFKDGNGNVIRITQSGSVAGASGTITGLPSGTASAAYNSGSSTFIFQSATSTAANIDGGSLLLRNLSPNSTYALTLSPPASLGANYTVTLPALPGSTSFLTMNTSGAISAATSISGGITGSMIASATITGSNIAAGTVTGSNIDSATITTANVAAATLTPANMATNYVISSITQTITTSPTQTNFTALTAVSSRPKICQIFQGSLQVTDNGGGGTVTFQLTLNNSVLATIATYTSVGAGLVTVTDFSQSPVMTAQAAASGSRQFGIKVTISGSLGGGGNVIINAANSLVYEL